MAAFELLEATIAGAQVAMATGQLTSCELVAAYVARIAAFDQQGPALNAISAINENALRDAERLDDERSARGPRGPLHGIPMLVKDNYETRDMQTAAGSILLRGWVPPHDAFLIKQLRQAGAIILAKTNMHEFASGITTVGSLFGATRNPYQLERNPGGSSGGTGAALAANLGLVGWGSDTCGSIRIPAAHNNLVGLRATQGLLSRTGIIPLSHTQDIGGPLARTVADVALALDATVGFDPDDPQTALSAGRIPGSYCTRLSPAGLRGVRLGLLLDLLHGEQEGSDVADVIRQNLPALRALGATVREVSLRRLTELLTDRLNGFLVIRHEFRHDINAFLTGRPEAPVQSLSEILASKKYHPTLEQKLQLAEGFESLDTQEYRDHLLKRDQLRLAIHQMFAEQELDALLYPTIHQTALPIGEEQFGYNCRLSANSGLPAISVPAGFTSEGLPVGLEMLGREWDEPKLLAYAYAFEQGTRHRRPPTSTPAL